MDWREEYRSKLTTAEEAVKVVKSGDLLAVGGSTDQPRVLQQALFARRDELKDIKIFHICPMIDPGWFKPGFEKLFDIDIHGFVGPFARPAVTDRRAGFIPNSWYTSFKADQRSAGKMKDFDIFMVIVSPPNRHGYCSLGAYLWLKNSYAKRSRIILAEVDQSQRWFYGDTTIHVSQVHAFVEHTDPLTSDEGFLKHIEGVAHGERYDKLREYGLAITPHQRPALVPVLMQQSPEAMESFAETVGLTAPPEAKAIAELLNTVIKDGDTFQIGQGSPSVYLVRLGAFAGKQDLGYHGEMTSRGVGWMIRDRQITGKYKTLFQGKAIFSALNGLSSEEVDWASENPKVEIYDTTYVTDPRTIAANDNMVAINNGLTIDLTGQINSESIFGAIPINGPGGQPESHLGAIVSKGGRAVTVMRSTALKGTVSCIVPQMDAGALVIIPRCYADIVITEFGIARLMGKSLRERADELIAIAHPNFRAELRKEAKKLLWP